MDLVLAQAAELLGSDAGSVLLLDRADGHRKMLTIRASRQEEHETKKRDFLDREFRYGAIERLMTLPQGVKAEDIKASFSNGLLQLIISIPEETAPKEVKVYVEHAQSKPAGGKTS